MHDVIVPLRVRTITQAGVIARTRGARRQWEGGGPEAWGRGGPWPIGGSPALVQSPKVCAPRQINKRTGVKHQLTEI